MIRRLALSNFKCFAHVDLSLGRLNVFAGSNGAGKSTVVQALLVLFQSARSAALARGQLHLNGDLIDLGMGRDVRYRRSETDRFEIVVGDGVTDWTVAAEVPASNSAHTLAATVLPEALGLDRLGGRILYLSADRLGPQKAYPMNMDDARPNEIGRRGEFAPLLYGRSRNTAITNRALLLENADKTQFADCETQFGLWMSRLFPGFQARTENQDQMDAVTLGLNLQRQIGEPEYLRPANVGYGVSVAFPIVLAGLLAASGTTLIIESPEAHLHPSAQSLVGEFLARVASGGVQVFVETHSDHVINGLRLAAKNEVLPPSEMAFFAFSKTDEYGSHSVLPVRLAASGEFDVRPDSFFDQADRDLKLIYGF